jgi:thiamine biosynthesis lipoprotein
MFRITLSLIFCVSRSLALLACVALLNVCPSNAFAQDDAIRTSRFEYLRPIMGTELKVILYAKDESHAAYAINAILEELDQRAKPINNYTPNSEVSRLANLEPGQRHKLSLELYEVLSEAKRWHDLTEHAFDVTAGSTIELWRKARKQKLLPSDEEVMVAQKCSGWNHLILSSDDNLGNTITNNAKGLQINVSGIATGYLIDHAMTILEQQGIESALIDIGGDIIVSNPPPDSDGWKIDLAGLRKSDPIHSRVVLKNQAVTTSGDLNQFLEIDAVRYSHIIDPKTGRPVPRRVSATVVAQKAIDADAAATAIAVLGIQRVKPLVGKMPIDSVVILEQDFQESDENDSDIRRFEWSRNLR